MSLLKKLTGADAISAVDAVGNVIDSLFTSDEEKAHAALLKQKLAQQPHLLQAEISKVEASHRSPFVAGWRPFIGYVCGVGLAFVFLVNPILQWTTGASGPEMPIEALESLVYALLGLGGLRTFEKATGKAK